MTLVTRISFSEGQKTRILFSEGQKPETETFNQQNINNFQALGTRAQEFIDIHNRKKEEKENLDRTCRNYRKF